MAQSKYIGDVDFRVECHHGNTVQKGREKLASHACSRDLIGDQNLDRWMRTKYLNHWEDKISHSTSGASVRLLYMCVCVGGGSSFEKKISFNESFFDRLFRARISYSLPRYTSQDLSLVSSRP